MNSPLAEKYMYLNLPHKQGAVCKLLMCTVMYTSRCQNSSISWTTASPQLTRCLRQTILTWIPCIFLWTFAPLESILIVRSKSRLIPWSTFNVTRLGFVAACILMNTLELGFHIYRYFKRENSPSADFIGSLIKVASFILLALFLIYHKWRGVHTSGVVWIFLFLSVFCTLPTYIQVWLNSNLFYAFEYVFILIYFPIIVGLFILCSFSDSPAEYTKAGVHSDDPVSTDTTSPACPEARASFPSSITFWWFNKLAILGYRKPLTQTDLWELNDEDKCSTIAPIFEKKWQETGKVKTTHPTHENSVLYSNDVAFVQRAKHQSTTNRGVLKALVKTFGWYFLSGSIFKFLSDILQFTNPQLLKALIQFIKKGAEEPLWHGVVIALCIFCVALLQTVFLNAYFIKMFKIGMRIRTSLTTLIYKKALNLSNAARKDTTVGEIVNLMSVDAQKFQDIMMFLNLIWSSPFQIIIAVYFLYQELGPSVFAGLGIMVIIIPINAVIATISKKLQVRQMKLKDERVKSMNEALGGMKVIKLYAWEETFISSILKIRGKELNLTKKMAYLTSSTMFVWTCAPFLVAFVTFAIYVSSDEKNILNAEKAFVSLTLFDLLRFPLAMLPQLITFLVMAAVSVKRLNKFLNSPELLHYVTREERLYAVEVENGHFRWEVNDEDNMNDELPKNVTLHDINLTINKGSLCAIVGSVGSGKSSLVSALLGEMDKVKGRVNIPASLSAAYVPQQAWIENMTLRDNILFGKPYDKKKYDKVISACALKADLSILPGGDFTEIGEKGINLSGGQKQRVSLARACYSDSDVYFLDDPLSAVDAHVAKHIFDKVLSSKSGILKERTRIFVTNSIEILPKVDEIVVLKDGRISERGNYDQLMSSKKDFSDFISQYSNNGGRESSPTFTRQESVEEKLVRSLSIKQDDKQEKKITEEEKAETGKVKFSIYILYFKTITWLWFSFTLLGNAGSQGASVASNVWLSRWSGDNSTGDVEADISQRNYRLLVYGILGLTQACAMLFASFSLVFGSLKASTHLHKSMLCSVFRSPMAFFDTTPLGRIVNRFSKDVETIDFLLPGTVRMFLLCLVQVVATFAVIASQTVIFLVVVLPIALFYFGIQKVYVSTSRQLKRLESVTRSPIYSHFGETLSGVSTIRAFSATNRFIRESNKRVDTNIMCYYPSIIANRWLSVRLEFCGNLIILSAALFAVFSRDELSPGMVGLSVSYAMSVTQTLNWVVRMSSELETNIVSVERINEYSSEIPSEAEWTKENKPSSDWPQNGVIEFENYSTRYRPGLDLVLNKVTAKLMASEKIGIVGRTGAGKSSITLALFRIIESAGGKILIDNVDISELGLHDLRSKLTIIPQDPVLFSGTLRLNLDPFECYNDDQIWKALEHSHLKQFVGSLDEGLEYKVSEGGSNLSVGQRQLICLARALLRKTKILVLDEATAAVDLETDSLIQTTIRTEFKDCTILTIAHRLHTIMDSDRVMVLDKGCIIEFDSPQNLLNDRNSTFYSLAKDAGIVFNQ